MFNVQWVCPRNHETFERSKAKKKKLKLKHSSVGAIRSHFDIWHMVMLLVSVDYSLVSFIYKKSLTLSNQKIQAKKSIRHNHLLFGNRQMRFFFIPLSPFSFLIDNRGSIFWQADEKIWMFEKRMEQTKRLAVITAKHDKVIYHIWIYVNCFKRIKRPRIWEFFWDCYNDIEKIITFNTQSNKENLRL